MGWRESLFSLPKKLLSGTSLVHSNSTTDDTEVRRRERMWGSGSQRKSLPAKKCVIL
ncbi:unnamed protein product [Acanthoscelides obtectus]|uniref:Uncharacterized protein n=1 Tax=Acanthoscelides obtectus TaxID=200917 RepID=A0A9P0KKL4_ACAOB|nr:unnamed protein product [Acanthoscelides obtectus]CAK1669227.1 hypothetical protein AOBTE_LOCUS26883 [Acanthoscelides obtectus]